MSKIRLTTSMSVLCLCLRSLYLLVQNEKPSLNVLFTRLWSINGIPGLRWSALSRLSALSILYLKKYLCVPLKGTVLRTMSAPVSSSQNRNDQYIYMFKASPSLLKSLPPNNIYFTPSPLKLIGKRQMSFFAALLGKPHAQNRQQPKFMFFFSASVRKHIEMIRYSVSPLLFSAQNTLHKDPFCYTFFQKKSLQGLYVCSSVSGLNDHAIVRCSKTRLTTAISLLSTSAQR